MSAIDQKYLALGGDGGLLGKARGPEQPCPDGQGHFRHFEGGSIYWHPNVGAFEVHGSILAKWASLGWERSLLGYPVTDETKTPDGVGRFNHFQGGSIYWHPKTGAFEVHGGIRAKWASLGWERSWLGYPLSDELPTGGNARFTRFQGGTIYWTPQHDAVPLKVKRPEPTYLFSLDKFTITNTRAWDDDTDYVNFSLKVGGAEELQHNIFMGDVDNGEYNVNLYFAPIRIIDNNTTIVFSFQILNSGHGDMNAVKEAMGAVSKELGTVLAATGNIWGKIAGGALPHVINFLVGIFTANCDGPVAVDKISATGDMLNSWTLGSGILSRTQFYPGTDSEWGCGSNSEYYVTWSVIRL